jgi:rare lipoprotein A (peptidoglycan hydrolase)
VTTPTTTIVGIASWYATGGPGIYAAAGPPLRRGNWRGETVTVCAWRCVALQLADWCQCLGTRVLDLSIDTVRALGLDPSRGLYRVEVTVP